MTEVISDKPLLHLEGMIGFAGHVPDGLLVHPTRQQIIYPVGNTVVIEDLSSRKQQLLSGHTGTVTALAVSKSGKYIASGQLTHMGFKADIIVWLCETKEIYAKFVLHSVKIEKLAFSPHDKYLVSLGGQDDGSVVVWNLDSKEAVCGQAAQTESAGLTYVLVYSNTSDETFITAGDRTLRIWTLDLENRKIRPNNTSLGKLVRLIKAVVISPDDSSFYCGTTTGDILKINMSSNVLQTVWPTKELFVQGVAALALLENNEMLVGAGDGTVCAVGNLNSAKFRRIPGKTRKMHGGVTSLSLRGKGHQFVVGTDKCDLYRLDYGGFSCELFATSHMGPVNDISFPHGCSDIFVTCSVDDVRVWHLYKHQELLRITLANFVCNAVDVMRDGHSIITGWDDSTIRAYSAESGSELYVIRDAHNRGVSALATFSDSQHIVSGGHEGDVRLWGVQLQLTGFNNERKVWTTKLLFSLKEHKAAVTCIKLRADNQQCVTSSLDGSCIIWDLNLERPGRLQMIRVNTLFMYCCYYPDECQIIATGTDRKIGYFETYDGAMIREVDGSLSGSINGMDIQSNGKHFVSGGDDRLVKVWMYDEGEATHVGIGHCAEIQRVHITPDQKHIVSVSRDGAILVWAFPKTEDTV